MKKIIYILALLLAFQTSQTIQGQKNDGVAVERALVTKPSKVGKVDLLNFKQRHNQCYNKPLDKQDGLLVDNMENVGLDTKKIQQLIAVIGQNNQDWYKDKTRHANTKKGCVDSFLLLKDGKLVVEEYFADAAQDKPHFQMSITKSITALALGIVLKQGKVKSEHDLILDYLPEVNVNKVPDLVKEIRISHLLSMNSGIRVNTDYKSVNHCATDACVPGILENCTMLKPGTTYKYQGVDPEILSHIIYNATGKSVEALVAEFLFKEMGIQEYSFQSSPCGLTKTAAGMILTSRGMIKIGQLVIDRGFWNASELINPQWIKKVNTSVVDNGKHQYGYYWWQHKVKAMGKLYEVKSCRGAQGQFIFIIPELNSVAVFTSYGTRKPFKYLEEFIVPALAVM